MNKECGIIARGRIPDDPGPEKSVRPEPYGCSSKLGK